MFDLKTIFTSNLAVECHILRGRLESEGIDCFIFNENITGVHPFWAVAVGGVKIQVPAAQVDTAKRIIQNVNKGLLIDENGEYDVAETLERAFAREKEVLSVKLKLRNNQQLPVYNSGLNLLNNEDYEEILQSEKEFMQWSAQKFEFNWKQFWFELFDYDRSVFSYLRSRPIEYYLEKELTDNFVEVEQHSPGICPDCRSGNVVFGPAINIGWNIPGLIFSFLIHNPFPVYRKNYHCFECGSDFSVQKVQAISE